MRLALEGHENMLREKPPSDGHRRTILDPEATHVGVGWAAENGRFQMAQEFLVRGLARLGLSASLIGIILAAFAAATFVVRLGMPWIAPKCRSLSPS